jgi:hypothetical protein
VEFLYSDEWLFPINSFIEHHCLIFSTADTSEFEKEKRKVYLEYCKTVASTLDGFIAVLGSDRS